MLLRRSANVVASGLPFARAGLPFEVVVQVEMPAAEGLQNTRCEVQRKEQYSPALILPHVNPFVCTAPCEEIVIDPNHDMAEGYRVEAKHRRQARNQAPDIAASHFDDAVNCDQGSAASPGEYRGEQSNQSGGRHPCIFQNGTEFSRHGSHELVLAITAVPDGAARVVSQFQFRLTATSGRLPETKKTAIRSFEHVNGIMGTRRQEAWDTTQECAKVILC